MNSQVPQCVLPHEDVQRFLLELIEQSTFKGNMTEFVTAVKNTLREATIAGSIPTTPEEAE
jgi:hypothetical protein